MPFQFIPFKAEYNEVYCIVLKCFGTDTMTTEMDTLDRYNVCFFL